jgi:hypothetical protein
MPAVGSTVFTETVAKHILDRIADGESLRAICKDDALPSRQTVLRWLWGECEEAKAFDFVAKYARAREAQGDAMDDKILETADNSTPETAPSDRVKIDAYKWRAEKLKPRVYGSKLEIDATVKQTISAVPLSADEWAARHAGDGS